VGVTILDGEHTVADALRSDRRGEGSELWSDLDHAKGHVRCRNAVVIAVVALLLGT